MLVSRTNLGQNAVVAAVARLLPSNGRSSEEATDAEANTRQLNLRTAVLGAGAVVAGYLVGRRLLGSGGPAPDDIRERAGEALPGNGVDVPIGDTTEDGVEEDEDVAAGADPTLEEIDERTQSDVTEEPAEPGEVQIDEDLVDEATEEDETEE